MAIDIWDMHCHVVPGVDDGSRSLDMSLEMLQRGYTQGIRHIICTPHYRRGMFETSRDEVEENFRKLKEAAKAKMDSLHLYLGCEFHVNLEMEELVLAEPRYRMNGKNYVLTEFGGGISEHAIMERCYALVNAGLMPVIAHAERIEAIRGKPKIIDDIHRLGGYLQLNADSILGYEGWSSKRFCAKMLKNGCVDFVGSDAHGLKNRSSHLAESYEFVLDKYGSDAAHALYFDHPLLMIRGTPL